MDKKLPMYNKPIRAGEGKGPYIDLYLALIRDGVAVEFSRGQLRRLLDSDDMDLDQSLLERAPERELSLEDQRIKQLEGRNLDGYNDSALRCYRAVLEDYKQRVISHPGKGLAIFYYNGFRVTAPVEFDSFQLYEYKDEWEGKYGIGGTTWAEQGLEVRYRM